MLYFIYFRRFLLGFGFFFGAGLLPLLGNDTLSEKDRAYFENKIRPLLVKHCYECHSADSKKLGGKLRLDHRDGLLAGGESGPVFIKGKPDESLTACFSTPSGLWRPLPAAS